jgi:hypothetical protein
MKKTFISVAIALLAMLVFASPILAWGGSAEAEVNCSDISVTDDTPSVGSTIIFSGTVTIVSEASDCGLGVHASASSQAWYTITDPTGAEIYSGWNIVPCVTDDGILWAEADAGQTYCWSQNVYVDLLGDYVAQQGGDASASYGHYELVWVQTGCKRWQGYWDVVLVTDDQASACSSVERTVTSHTSNMAGMAAHPVLVIELPDGRTCYFASDGWNDPTTKDIVFSAGTWQIEIAAGTIIQLDGNWHEKTWLLVDDQGNVTGEYGNAETATEDIGLSQPIKITKIS